ncbi:MAG: ABC transporter ATP-binding protein [Desulfomonile tiedjei]|nr:ABC transporter ATP-binding protein [Desulfomonile tiedjei]
MILSVHGIHFSYNSHPVLEDVSFRLDRGQILAILGVNGAGKSTLLKCINRILHPERGSVLLNGDDVLNLRREEIAKRLGYVPQRYLEEQLTVFDAVLLGRKPHMKWGAAERDLQVVERVLRMMGLERCSLRPVSTLSGGETQKVIIARALAQEPEALLLDEPTSNLDIRNQIEVMTLIRRVVEEQGVSAIICVHDLNLAVRFADRFLMLKGGTIHAYGDRTALKPSVIREVYGIDVIVGEIAGYPVVIPTTAEEPAI